MDSIANLRRRYTSERRTRIFDALPRWEGDGLRLGRGTLLARIGSGTTSRFDEDADRLLVLLSTVHRRQALPLVLKHARRAAVHWTRGDAALAHIELAFARMPRLEDEDDAFRLFLAETLLDDGLTPHGMARELGLDMLKYDPDQPRVPAGSGRESGRWGPGSGSPAAAANAVASSTTRTTDISPIVGRSLLADTSPGIVRALATFAARFSVPTAVLGALFIPTPNSGGVTDGTLPGAPDITYRRDGPAGTLRLTQLREDGSEASVVAQNRRGI